MHSLAIGQVNLPDADLYAGIPKLNNLTPKYLPVALIFEFCVSKFIVV
jgi:hypothetical protein